MFCRNILNAQNGRSESRNNNKCFPMNFNNRLLIFINMIETLSKFVLFCMYFLTFERKCCLTLKWHTCSRSYVLYYAVIMLLTFLELHRLCPLFALLIVTAFLQITCLLLFFLIFSNQIVLWHRRTVKVKWSYLNSPTVDVGTGLELRQGCMYPEGGGGVKEEVTVGPV